MEDPFRGGYGGLFGCLVDVVRATGRVHEDGLQPQQ